jgi:hypothetical protein
LLAPSLHKEPTVAMELISELTAWEGHLTHEFPVAR